MTVKLLKLLLGVLIITGHLEAGQSYTRQDIVKAAEGCCRKIFEEDN